MNDLKFALRQLLKNPGFATVAMLTLALGIGANLALFAILNDLLFRPKPVARPDELWAIEPADTNFCHRDVLTLRRGLAGMLYPGSSLDKGRSDGGAQK